MFLTLRRSATGRRNTLRLLAATATAGTLALSVLLAGCGGGTNDAVSNLAPGQNSGGANFAGRSYQSVVTLGEARKGTLDLSVAADGTANGTIKVEETATRQVAIGTFPLSGLVDLLTGALNLTGSYTVDGQTFPLSIQGTLPTLGTTGGTVKITVNGQTFTSTFSGTGTGGATLPTGFVIATSAGASAPSLLIGVGYGAAKPKTGSFPVQGAEDTNTAIVTYNDGTNVYAGRSGTVEILEISSKVRYKLTNVSVQTLDGSKSLTLSGSGQTTVPYVAVDLGGLGGFGF